MNSQIAQTFLPSMLLPLPSLYPHQRDALEFLLEQRSGILADDMGLGKSRVALVAAACFTSGEPDRSVLIVAPKSATGVWRYEIERWLGERSSTYRGSADLTPELARLIGRSEVLPKFLITNYEQVPSLLNYRHRWSVVIGDEAHLLRKRNTIRYGSFSELKAKHMLLLTGSPIVNGADDLWTLLHLIDREHVTSYWRWVKTYLHTYINSAGHQEIAGIRDIEGLKATLSPYMLRRHKQDVLHDLPPKIREYIPLDMTTMQSRAYHELAQNMMLTMINATLDDEDQVLEEEHETIAATNLLALFTRLRQLLICPRLIGLDDDGAALDALSELVSLDFDAQLPIIVYTPFSEAIPYIVKAITKLAPNGKVPNVMMLDGQSSEFDRASTLNTFQTSQNPYRALVCTIGVATSWTATAAKVVYFVGSSWTAAANEQAEDRAHRIGQADSVLVRYFACRDTIDEHIQDIVERKATLSSVLSGRASLYGRGLTPAGA